MFQTRRLLALPLALGLGLAALPAAAPASEVRDAGHLFSPEAVHKAQEQLDRIERAHKIPVTIETIPSLRGAVTEEEYARWKGKKPVEVINLLAERTDREAGGKGVYILIDKKEHVLSNVLIPNRLERRLTRSKRAEIREAITDEFKKKDFDGGLLRGVKRIGQALDETRGESARAGGVGPVARRVPPAGPGAGPRPVPQAPNAKGSSGMSAFIIIILVILAVVIGLRLLGSLFGAGRSGYAGPQRMGGPGGPPGVGPGAPGPGYGGYGYGGGYGGGRGGGFFSSLFGGMGGALAGNWLYDQFSGRHGGGTTPTTYNEPGYTPAAPEPAPGGDEIVGADDNGGQGGDWGGGDAGGGGDWGGGDAGGGGGDWGGGDVGGGGGDWGGGGGDWGGGDAGGGGDW
ncbi:MAG TPA: TPM domain-containing protein [Isosphaeraceae bacterium]|nr:TPM domain-containing protein [Isosphaeraceae bacterium]